MKTCLYCFGNGTMEIANNIYDVCRECDGYGTIELGD